VNPAAPNALAIAASAPPDRRTLLQLHIGRLGEALDAIERLPARERAVALDLTSRAVSKALGRQQPVLEEFDLWPL
jgi:hypothetical protein